MRILLPLIAGLSSLVVPQVMAEPKNDMVHLRVTVTNGTAGNALSPFVVLLHDRSQSLFTLGQPSSPGLALLAETGNASVLAQEWDQLSGMPAHFQAEGAPLMAGESRSVEFMVPMASKDQTLLTVAAMIGRSNDSFIALRDVDLSQIKTSWTMTAQNYDAGSEENSGNVEDFGPGGHPTAQAELRVSFDRGLNPRGNAPENWAWGPAAATVKLEIIP